MRFFCLLSILMLTHFVGLSQQIEVRKLDALKPYLHPENDTIYVINFWATWCKPCVAELPHFVEAGQQVADSKVQFIMVNLDHKKNLTSTVIPFLEKNPLPGRQILLDETNYNHWIPLINADWGGAIPVTLFSSREKQIFLERDVKSTGELLDLIKSLINNN